MDASPYWRWMHEIAVNDLLLMIDSINVCFLAHLCCSWRLLVRWKAIGTICVTKKSTSKKNWADCKLKWHRSSRSSNITSQRYGNRLKTLPNNYAVDGNAVDFFSCFIGDRPVIYVAVWDVAVFCFYWRDKKREDGGRSFSVRVWLHSLHFQKMFELVDISVTAVSSRFHFSDGGFLNIFL